MKTLYFDKTLIFKYVPLFSSLSFFEKRLIFDSLEIVEVKKSQLIYRQGDAPDAFYCIVTGRVEIFIEKDNTQETLEHIHRGKYFGFISLLTGETHSVSARAINDTVLAKIPKERFDLIIKNIPRLAVDLSRMLSRRLRKKDLHPKLIFESTIIAVYGDSATFLDAPFYALNLAYGLKSQTHKKVIVVDVGLSNSLICDTLGIDSSFGFTVTQQFFSAEEAFVKIIKQPNGVDILRVLPSAGKIPDSAFLTSLLTLLVNDYHYCIVYLTTDFKPGVFKVLDQCDLVHFLFSPDPQSIKDTISSMEQAGVWTDTELKKKIKPIVLEESGFHGKGPKLSYEQEASLFHQPIFATIPVLKEKGPFLIGDDFRDGYSKVIRRISRQLGEVLIGLALGSGSAMGMAHIGVLKVLEKEGIPVDMVAGSSMGALIGALWCCGYTASEIEEIMLENKDKKFLFGVDDLAFPVHGLIKGRHVHRFLSKYLKNMTFCDVKRTFKIIACDCLSMKQVVFESGRLIDAVLASISIPGVFKPYKIAGHYYMDGGILNPLPTDVLVEYGAKKIISVNVLPSPDEIERTRECLNESKFLKRSRWPVFEKIVNAAKRQYTDIFRPNIFDVIVSSVQSMEYLLAQVNSLSQSDVAMHPDMTGVCWYSFENTADLIKRGEEEALLHLSEIKELINQTD